MNYPLYRAWNHTHKYMTTNITMTQLNNHEFKIEYSFGRETVFYYTDAEDGISISPETGWSLMRFTGRLDNEDFPIYEGDIVKGKHYKEPYSMKTSIEGTGEVEWIDHPPNIGWFIKGGPPKGFRTYLDFRDCEVIGNIYENQKMLGGKNDSSK